MSTDSVEPPLDLGPEWAALELLAIGPATAAEAASLDEILRLPSLDPGELIEQAMRQKLVYCLAGYLDRSELQGRFPETVRDPLRTLLGANRLRTARLRRETIAVADTLRDAGVRFACTKGIIFESLLYGADGTRAMRDVDFMIAPDDRDRVAELMLRLGFQVGRYDGARGVIELDRRTALTYKLHPDHLPHFSKLIDDPILPAMMVDFANSFTWSGSAWQVPVEAALDQTPPHPVPGALAELPRLTPPFQFLFTILHLFREAWLDPKVSTGNDVDLAKFADVLRCFLRERDEIQTGGFGRLVDAHQLHQPVCWVLDHLDRVFRTEVARSFGWEGIVTEEWLASARAAGGAPLPWSGDMRRRLWSRDRGALFSAIT